MTTGGHPSHKPDDSKAEGFRKTSEQNVDQTEKSPNEKGVKRHDHPESGKQTGEGVSDSIPKSFPR